MLDEGLARARVKEAIQKGLLAQQNSRNLGKKRKSVSASLWSALCALLTIGSRSFEHLERAAHRVNADRLAINSRVGTGSAVTTRELVGRWCGD